MGIHAVSKAYRHAYTWHAKVARHLGTPRSQLGARARRMWSAGHGEGSWLAPPLDGTFLGLPKDYSNHFKYNLLAFISYSYNEVKFF